MSRGGSFDFSTPEQAPKKKISILKIVLILLVLLAIAAGAVFYMAYSYVNNPVNPEGQEIEITIYPGQPFQSLAENLVKQGVLPDVERFALLAHYKQLSGKVQTGRFLVNTGWSPMQTLTHLTSGKPLLERVTIPEGLPWWEVAKRLEKAGLVRYEDFAEVVKDNAFLRHWGIPFPTAEGFLYPDTYYIMRPLVLDKNSAKTVAGRLVDNFWRRTAPLWPDGRRPDASGAGVVQYTVNLGSIIEKETAVADERTRVAGVYSNRLKAKMLLQADPTIIYGIGPSFDGDIRRSDLNNAANLYNTYKHVGLPPGPICSPGLASMRAAQKPEDHDLYYFVARGDGSHTFSNNLKEHNIAVRLYRAAMRSGDSGILIPGGVVEPEKPLK